MNATESGAPDSDTIRKFDESQLPSLQTVGRGWLNLGNSCYFNATLQCMLHSNAFPLYTRWFLRVLRLLRQKLLHQSTASGGASSTSVGQA